MLHPYAYLGTCCLVGPGSWKRSRQTCLSWPTLVEKLDIPKVPGFWGWNFKTEHRQKSNSPSLPCMGGSAWGLGLAQSEARRLGAAHRGMSWKCFSAPGHRQPQYPSLMDGTSPAQASAVIWQFTSDPERKRELCEAMPMLNPTSAHQRESLRMETLCVAILGLQKNR